MRAEDVVRLKASEKETLSFEAAAGHALGVNVAFASRHLGHAASLPTTLIRPGPVALIRLPAYHQTVLLKITCSTWGRGL